MDRLRELVEVSEPLAREVGGRGAVLAWTEAYLMRRKHGDGDRSQHELRCIARVLEVALLYDHLNVTS